MTIGKAVIGRLSSIALAGACAWMMTASGCTRPQPGQQVVQHFSGRVVRPVQYDYLLYLPHEYGTTDQRWPLVFYLHGAGERGNDLELLKRNGPPMLIAQGRSFPFILAAPQCPKGGWWDGDALNELLGDVIARYDVDEDRVYLTGLSMGGSGTWNLAILHPDRFAAIVPICGAGFQPYTARKRLANVPIWVFHGAKDQTVPLQASQMVVDSLKKANADVRFTIYPDAGHDAWTATYNNPAMWDWLLSQRRIAAAAPTY